jgi:hypothetical protein
VGRPREQVVLQHVSGELEILEMRRDCESVFRDGRTWNRFARIATPFGRVWLLLESTPVGVEGSIDV